MGGAIRENRRLDIALGLAIVALLVACYLPSLGGDFIWDDDANVSTNATLRNRAGLEQIWTTPFANQQYYPLTHTSFWMEYQIWGLWTTGYRVTNLALHALIALLVWIGLRRLEVPGAWLAAAVFAVHPVHVETVAWITERKNLLSGVLYWAAFLAYLRYAGLDRRGDPPVRPGRLAYATALLCFAGALLSKSAVVTLPAALIVVLWWKRGRLRGRDLLPLAPLVALGAAMGAVTWWLERNHVGAAGPEWDLGAAERVLVAGRAVVFYAGKTLWPLGLNFIYPRWTVDTGTLWTWIFPLTALAVPAAAWALRRRIGRGPAAGLAYFGLTLSPALGFIGFYFQLYSFVQDHLQYLASVGLIAVAVALATTAARAVPTPVKVVAVVLLLAALGGLSMQRTRAFNSREALWTDVLARNPRAWLADLNLGLVRLEQERPDEALAHFRSALETPHGERHKVHYNLAIVLDAQGKKQEARYHYEQAIELEPGRTSRTRFLAQAHNNLGNLLDSLGETDEALAHLRAAVEVEPLAYVAHTNLAARLARDGDSVAAERHYREAIRIKPDHVPALSGLGLLVASQGRHGEAVEMFHAALALAPSLAVVHYNLGYSQEALEDPAAAEASYRAAIRLDPQLAEPHNNLAIVLYHRGRFEEARREIERFRALGGSPHPDFVRALAQATSP